MPVGIAATFDPNACFRWCSVSLTRHSNGYQRLARLRSALTASSSPPFVVGKSPSTPLTGAAVYLRAGEHLFMLCAKRFALLMLCPTLPEGHWGNFDGTCPVYTVTWQSSSFSDPKVIGGISTTIFWMWRATRTSRRFSDPKVIGGISTCGHYVGRSRYQHDAAVSVTRRSLGEFRRSIEWQC